MQLPLFALLLASAAVTISARPIHDHDHDHGMAVREFHYPDIEAQSDYGAARVTHQRRQQHKRHHHRHHEDRTHNEHRLWEDFSGEFEEFDRGHGPFRRGDHGDSRDDIVDNIIEFLSHEARRSVPDVSARVVDGIKDFLSHHTRRDGHGHHHHHHHSRHHHHERSLIERAIEFFAWED